MKEYQETKKRVAEHSSAVYTVLDLFDLRFKGWNKGKVSIAIILY